MTEQEPTPIFSVAYARFLLAIPFLALAVLLKDFADMWESVAEWFGRLSDRIAGGWPDE